MRGVGLVNVGLLGHAPLEASLGFTVRGLSHSSVSAGTLLFFQRGAGLLRSAMKLVTSEVWGFQNSGMVGS